MCVCAMQASNLFRIGWLHFALFGIKNFQMQRTMPMLKIEFDCNILCQFEADLFIQLLELAR